MTVDLAVLDNSQRALPGVGQLNREKGSALMSALGSYNERWGCGSVIPGSAGIVSKRATWATKFGMRSPAYTTRCHDLPTVMA